MSKNHIKIDEETLQILKDSTIEGNVLKLPQIQLARPLYEKVNKILTMSGGKWNKKLKGHIFDSNPSERLGLAVEKGEILDKKKELQAFYTPREVARRMVELAEISSGNLVLEPSAGRGAIAAEIQKAGAAVDCIEIDSESCEKLCFDGFKVECKDFLTVEPEPIYDAVLLNPPFAGGAEVDHVCHAFKFLKTKGRLVAIVSPAFQFRTTKKYKAFKEFIDNYLIFEEELPEGTFKESGTNIRTVIIVLENS